MKRFFGIDLGTTNSVISCISEDENGNRHGPEAIEIEQYNTQTANAARTKILPSYVYYGSDSQPIVGEFARTQYSLYPERVAKSIKSQMGKTTVDGLAPDIQDKTPEMISARILNHLKTEAEKNPEIRQRITEVIIAVPANFDIAQKEATLRAAELAGFSVKTPEGKWKQILISEPNAVLYDVAQKYISSKHPNPPIDFSRLQHVIIFDMGGGTLDITFHEVKPLDHNELEISEISSARYSRLAGDLFDAKMADFIYNRYKIRMQSVGDDIKYQDALDRKKTIISRLIPTAEDIKIQCSEIMATSEADSNGDGLFGDDDMETAAYCDTRVGNEVRVKDEISTQDYEAVIRPLLGEDLCFNDYRTAKPQIGPPKNIIIPLLDVLAKADRYYQNLHQTLKVDAVILNGGMCKLYWIQERLRMFFGFDPILTDDPALSVANGAATYASLLEEKRERQDQQVIAEKAAKGQQASAERKKPVNPRSVSFVRFKAKIFILVSLPAPGFS